MEELLVFLFQVFFEILANTIGQLLVDLIWIILDEQNYDWMLAEPNLKEPRTFNFAGLLFFNLLTGFALGFISLEFYHTTWVHSPHARLLALGLSPLFSGLLSYRLADFRKETGSVPRHHFWWAFAFTFGFSIVRFTFCHRP